MTCALARNADVPGPTRSACERCPHARHSNSAWLLRLAFSQCPHSGHVRLVFLRSTGTTGTPASFALYPTKVRNWKNAQPLCLARRGLRTVVRSRIPRRSLQAIPRPSVFGLRNEFLADDVVAVLAGPRLFAGGTTPRLPDALGPFATAADRACGTIEAAAVVGVVPAGPLDVGPPSGSPRRCRSRCSRSRGRSR